MITVTEKDDNYIKVSVADEGDKMLYDYFGYYKDSEFDDYDYDTQSAVFKEVRRLIIAKQRSINKGE